MTRGQWPAFSAFRDDFRRATERWAALSDELIPLQRAAAEKDTPPYSIETSVVYNRALDEITAESDLRLIVIGDNPGKNEQLAANRRYLVGQSGKLAERFFRQNPELGTDFRTNAVILNKTPVHTAKTSHLRKIAAGGNPAAAALIAESQLWMARRTAELHIALTEGARAGSSPDGGGRSAENGRPPAVFPQAARPPELWLVGYAELKANGVFAAYREALKEAYRDSGAWNQVYVFQHFSMNRFTIDLNRFRSENPNLNLTESLRRLGEIHRKEIFGA